MSENKYPIGGYAPLKQLLDDLIECVINDRLVLGATPNGRPHDPDPEIDRLRKEILNIYGKPAGAVWVKGAPKELKQHFARVPAILEDNVIYDAIIWPTSNPDYWWALGHGFKFSIHKDKITEYLDESGVASNNDDEWIDVNDRLPEEAGRYWCYIKHLTDLGFSYFQWNCDYNPQLRRFSDMTLKDGEQITHWRPLAEPPTIKQEGRYP